VLSSLTKREAQSLRTGLEDGGAALLFKEEVVGPHPSWVLVTHPRARYSQIETKGAFTKLQHHP